MRKNIKYLISAIVAFFLILIIYNYREAILELFNVFKSEDNLKDCFRSMGKGKSIGIFILMQIIQVVIFFIPGHPIEIIGGYLFGVSWGTILSVIGIAAGSAILFAISKALNRNIKTRYTLKNKKSIKLKQMLNSTKINIVVFFLYLIPGVPKDNLIYVCALTQISIESFLLYSMVGRTPGIIMASAIGAEIGNKNLTTLIIITAIMTVIFVLCAINRQKLFNKISSIR
jgi:uncharacterized membrane protein YdjX (TVP38/TMEM64 family)